MPDTVLTNLERRAVANLSIPRNVDDLARMLTDDPHVRDAGGVSRHVSGREMHELMPELVLAGLVLDLGEHEDLAKLASRLQSGTGKFASAVPMHDDKASTYCRRLEAEHREWRGRGSLYAYTAEAHGLLTGPPPGFESPVITTAELERMIVLEHERLAVGAELVGSIFDEEQEPGDGLGGGRLAIIDEDAFAGLHDAMISEELAHWVKLVSDEHFSRTGRRPRLPIAGGAGYGDATELLILAADTGGTAYGETSPTFGALTTVAVTDADTGSTITRATYTGYADKSIANSDYNSASAGAHTNANAITWANATAGSSTVIGFARVTTSGGGRLIRYGTTASVAVSAANTPASIAAGSLSDNLD